jgi:acyl-coenzyme A thioesterase PaaI-like protein
MGNLQTSSMPTLHEFLQARQLDNNDWAFTVPAELHGAFGGAFGGVVASCTLVAARAAAPDRTPNALDIRFLRGLSAGDAVTTTTVLRAGRSLTNVAVDLRDPSGRLCARSTISLVDAAVLHPFEETQATPRGWDDYEGASSFPAVAPIVSVIGPRFVGRSGADIATAIRVPWDDAGHSAEAACMAGDMAVGAPLGGTAPRGVGTPNPDISLRFCGEVATPVVTGIGRWERSANGVAMVSVEVWSDDALVAIGVSTALLLPTP